MMNFTSGVARGAGGLPLAETLPPPPSRDKLNYTLYRGLWRAAILSPSQPPLLTPEPEPPCSPPHFEKSSYAPEFYLKYMYSKNNNLFGNDLFLNRKMLFSTIFQVFYFVLNFCDLFFPIMENLPL